MNTRLDQALEYRRRGWPIIPVKGKEYPLVEWGQYQTRMPTEEEVKEWWTKWPDANIVLLTGQISDIVVFDVDTDKGDDPERITSKQRIQKLLTEGCPIPATVCVRTGGGGDQFYFRWPGFEVRNFQGNVFGDGIDFRGDGGYVVLPPSIHPVTGKEYEWLLEPGDGVDGSDGISPMPEWLLTRIKGKSEEKSDWRVMLTQAAPSGTRHGRAVSIAGGLLATTAKEEWETAAWPRLSRWFEEHCQDKSGKNPMELEEVRRVFNDIAAHEAAKPKEDYKAKGKKPSVADTLVRLVLDNPQVELFRDQYGSAFARMPVGDHREIWQCDSSHFRQLLSKLYWDASAKAPDATSIATALSVLKAKAIFEGKEYELHSRIAKIGDTVWYDLANSKWEAVRITKEGWDIISSPPILFRRHTYHSSQVAPVAGGEVREILRFINAQGEDQQLLSQVQLVVAFIPGFPHPISYIFGPQGSSKSTYSEMHTALIDPSHVGVLNLRSKLDEVAQTLAHQYLSYFDNVSRIYSPTADLLCRAVTGSGFSKRGLYTNDDDFIYRVKSVVGINGIGLGSLQPDLLQRSILFELRPLDKTTYKAEGELKRDFEEAKPRILGAILTAVSKALAAEPGIKLEHHPRMADFTRWGCACVEALGYSQGQFLAAYDRNIEEQNDEVLNDHIEATLAIEFMENKPDVWEGKASELLVQFKGMAFELGLEDSRLAKSPSALSRKLRRLETNLREAGYSVTIGKGKVRRITIRRLARNAVDAGAADTPQSQPSLVG